MLLDVLVATSKVVAGTRSRLAKRDALAALLGQAAPADIEILVTYLAGELRQRRTGIGWSQLASLPEPADSAGLTLTATDAELQRIAELSGPGSAGARSVAVQGLFALATADEQQFLRRLIGGEIRQGALDSTVLDALAQAASVPLGDIRRAVMLAGATGPVAVAVLVRGPAALADFGLKVGQPVRPMLAGSASDVAAALAKIGGSVVLDVKLDGIRIQAHKEGGSVRLFTRSLEDITGRLPEIAGIVAQLPGDRLILDGEVLAIDDTGRSRPFQETASRTASRAGRAALSVFFFDCLVSGSRDLIDEPLSARIDELDAAVPVPFRVGRLVTDDVIAAEKFFADALAAGQEGLVVKSLHAPYDAGRRGSGWIKVKPRHTLDLVVLAVEWGSGRRRGQLSNIHLGARRPGGDPADPAGWVMLGKTFKGMTDEMLAWQTDRFQQLEISRNSSVVQVRPEQLVEIAFDGVQRSRRYPGGVALRFARVLRYRDDKPVAEADTIETVQALAVGWDAAADQPAGQA